MIFLLISVFLTQTSYAAKVKFHKPETEAEKALDMILRVENGLEKNSKLKHEGMFTKEFDEDYKKQQDEALNSESCKKEGGIYCCFSRYVKNIITTSGGKDIYYFASKTKLKGQLLHWTGCEDKRNKCVIGAKGGEYYMKKEDGKWKIDGFNTGEYDGDLKINVDYSDKSYY
jgi:hypothetical protein